MTKYLAGVLSVIAVGVLLIAYGLLAPRTAAYASMPLDPMGRPILAGDRVSLPDDPYAARFNYPGAPAPYGYVNSPAGSPAAARPAAAVRTVSTQPVQARTVSQRVEPASSRNWQKTALIIGGTTAAGAGLGGAFGGKKGALIGAAIGGGASTLYEATRNPQTEN